MHTLEAALWAFARATDFESGLKAVIALGDDTDTTGAVYGQLAGAYWGVDAIPQRWCDKLLQREAIVQLADDLHRFASQRDGANGVYSKSAPFALGACRAAPRRLRLDLRARPAQL